MFLLNRQSDPNAIPHPPRRLPFLGDILGFSLRKPTQMTIEMHKKLGPLFELRFPGLRFVFASGPEMVAELCDEKRFVKEVIPDVAALRELAGDGLFTAYSDEPNWRKAHDLLRPAFTQSAMRSYHSIMCDVTSDLLTYWDTKAGTKQVDVSPDMTKLTLETIGRTGFSYGFDSFEREKPHPFVEAMVGSLSYSQLIFLRDIPFIGLAFRKADARNRARIDYLNGVIAEIIRKRQATDYTGPDDLLELMVRAAREDDPNRLDEENIRFQILTFLVAGHETTSGALSFALYYLARNPEIRALAQQEVDEVWGDNPRPEFEQVAKLRYIRRVLDEGLRLWPTAPGFARGAREDTVLADGREMKKGDWMVVSIPGLHRDPSVWGKDADAFDPDRFLPVNVKSRPAHVYKPFGTGERACIGRQFALHEAILVLGSILRRYDFAPDPDYKLEVAERLTLMPEGFTLNLTRRDG